MCSASCSVLVSPDYCDGDDDDYLANDYYDDDDYPGNDYHNDDDYPGKYYHVDVNVPLAPRF